MTFIDWVPSLTMTSIFAFALWLGRNLITTHLTKSVQHKFDLKLESLKSRFREHEELVKSDLRSKESEIAALRGSAMTAMTSRQMAIDRRRLEAVDQLWSSVIALRPARTVSSLMAVLKFDKFAEMAVRDPKVREMFTMIGSHFDPRKINLSDSAKARPFVSPMAWALFSAYQVIAMEGLLKVEILKSGIDSKNLFDKNAVAKLVKAALPHREDYIDKFGDAGGYYYLLDELEEKLLNEIQRMLAGIETDKASVAQAAEILRQSNELMNELIDSDRQGNLEFNNV